MKKIIDIIIHWVLIVVSRIMPPKNIVLVVGMHRSGTSAITGIIADLGFFPGTKLLAPTQFNSKGFFEDKDINFLNDKILADYGFKWFNYNGEILHFSGDSYPVLTRILWVKFIRKKNIVIKDPRLAITFDLFYKRICKMGWRCKVIRVKRDADAILSSLLSRNDFLEADKVKNLILDYENSLNNHLANKNYHQVAFDEVLKNKDRALEQMADYLQVQLTKDNYSRTNLFLDHKLKTS